VNLHLMMVSFYRPAGRRRKILIEAPAFPSDTYAVKTQIRSHGLDPTDALIEVAPRDGEATVRDEDVLAAIAEAGDELALVMLGAVSFLTGQLFDVTRITAAAHDVGARAGFDLAHAAGNVPLRLHDDGVDFAVWCTYKYMNAGPGGIAGCFVHERHGRDRNLVRFGGWWGNDPATRFRMHLEPDFVPREGADGWQLSNPPILAMAPLRASLEIFDRVGMDRLRQKSVRLTGYLEWILGTCGRPDIEILTPTDADRRGCQLSLRVRERPRETFRAIEARGCVGDFREPDVIRVAPVPSYNSFHDVFLLGSAIAETAPETGP